MTSKPTRCFRNFFSVIFAFGVWVSAVHGQGTAFTYQGKLQSTGAAATGFYDFTFGLLTSSNGIPAGNPITNFSVGVTNGLFTTTLDFGPAFTGNALWLSIGVRTNGATNFTTLSPAQPLTPTPYAIFAANASTVTGPISASQLPASVLTNGETNVNLFGSFTGNGSSLTNINTASLISTNGAGYPIATNTYATNGIYSFTVPVGTSQMVVKLWGAGGQPGFYGSHRAPGAGAFAEVIEAVTPGQTYVVVVGQNGNSGEGSNANNASGGSGGTAAGTQYGGNGGQGSSLFLLTNSSYIMQAVAGGGGGGGNNNGGGWGKL